MFLKNENCSITPCEPGVTRKVMACSDDAMQCVRLPLSKGPGEVSIPTRIRR